MPGLTVSEKTHWKERISARIARRIEALKAQHPALFDRVKREAHAQALQSLGLADPYAELEAIHAEEEGLAKRKKRAQQSMIATLRGVPLDEVSDNFVLRYGCELPLPQEAAESIGKLSAAHQEQLLADDPVGLQIARLEAERDRLLDVVWLASSSTQIRALWSKVAELLGDEPTVLEREALAINPPRDV
jgi:hypothetical protein